MGVGECKNTFTTLLVSSYKYLSIKRKIHHKQVIDKIDILNNINVVILL
jgi:hypothetical protein